jgi:hypothetical protein
MIDTDSYNATPKLKAGRRLPEVRRRARGGEAPLPGQRRAPGLRLAGLPRLQLPDGPGVKNTDREIWREREGDYYADSIHVTEGGGIGINCGGMVYVKPLREWHRLAKEASVAHSESGSSAMEQYAEREKLIAASHPLPVWRARKRAS